MKPLDIKNFDTAKPAERRPSVARRQLVGGLRAIAQAALALAVLGTGFFAYQALLANKETVSQRPAREQVFAVRTVQAAYSTHVPTLRLYGEAVAGRQVELRVLAPGEVVGVGENFRDGSLVKQGEMLLEIDKFAYQGALVEARANLREAEARLAESAARVKLEEDGLARAEEQLTLARRDLDRAVELVRGGALSEKTVDDRKLVVSQREQAVEQHRNTLAVEEARADQQRAGIARLEWRVSEAERHLANTTLAAPFDAHVRGVSAALGRVMNANDVAATLIGADEIEVRLSLTDNQYGRIVAEAGAVIGRPVEVVWNLGSVSSRYAGRIERVAAEIKPESGGVAVFARIDASAGAPALRPGAFVEVLVPDRAYPDAVRLPETALYGADTVYVVADDGRLKRREVELLGRDGGDVFVTGALKPGERVVASRISEIGEGLKVEEQP
ncbi:MAG: efflux RND transporter periplasmic adaptor subunit [Hyphomicrobiales bacterium]|nr:efflux RND transporter periplasmic adaptor subunit [Hyphomicrobiales bacterium]